MPKRVPSKSRGFLIFERSMGVMYCTILGCERDHETMSRGWTRVGRGTNVVDAISSGETNLCAHKHSMSSETPVSSSDTLSRYVWCLICGSPRRDTSLYCRYSASISCQQRYSETRRNSTTRMIPLGSPPVILGNIKCRRKDAGRPSRAIAAQTSCYHGNARVQISSREESSGERGVPTIFASILNEIILKLHQSTPYQSLNSLRC